MKCDRRWWTDRPDLVTEQYVTRRPEPRLRAVYVCERCLDREAGPCMTMGCVFESRAAKWMPEKYDHGWSFYSTLGTIKLPPVERR